LPVRDSEEYQKSCTWQPFIWNGVDAEEFRAPVGSSRRAIGSAPCRRPI
jgi:hypothetical protein